MAMHLRLDDEVPVAVRTRLVNVGGPDGHSDGRCTHRCGEVHRAGVVCNDDVELGDERGESLQIGLAGEATNDISGAGASHDPGNDSFLRRSAEHRHTDSTNRKLSGELAKALGRPLLAFIARTRNDSNAAPSVRAPGHDARSNVALRWTTVNLQ